MTNTESTVVTMECSDELQQPVPPNFDTLVVSQTRERQDSPEVNVMDDLQQCFASQLHDFRALLCGEQKYPFVMAQILLFMVQRLVFANS